MSTPESDHEPLEGSRAMPLEHFGAASRHASLYTSTPESRQARAPPWNTEEEGSLVVILCKLKSWKFLEQRHSALLRQLCGTDAGAVRDMRFASACE
tara:strand:- start:2063 stop:2353 length:291 start_codon:yes stop_codon:yes gene_type:complete